MVDLKRLKTVSKNKPSGSVLSSILVLKETPRGNGPRGSGYQQFQNDYFDTKEKKKFFKN